MQLQMIKRNLLLGCLVVGTVGMVATAAKAGYKQTTPVSIGTVLYNPGTGVPVPATQVTGGLGSARAASDTTQYIGCSTNYDSNTAGGLGQAQCFARDAAGNTAACTATGSDFRAAVRSITSQSYLAFTILGSTCVQLYITAQSDIAPTAP